MTSRGLARDPLRVALIDSGLGSSLPAPTVGARFWLDGDQVQAEAPWPDRLGHGSAVAAILCAESAGARLELFNAQVFGERLVTTPRAVAAALDWAVASAVRVVCMSLGLREERDVLGAACARALEAGAILVASTPIRGGPTYPAAYPGVLEAVGDARCGPGEFSQFAAERFGANPAARAVPGPGEAVGGSSFACPRVAAAIIRLLDAEPKLGRTALLGRLEAAASYRGPQKPPR